MLAFFLTASNQWDIAIHIYIHIYVYMKRMVKTWGFSSHAFTSILNLKNAF